MFPIILFILTLVCLPTVESKLLAIIVVAVGWASLYIAATVLWLWDNLSRVRLRNPFYLEALPEVVVEKKRLSDEERAQRREAAAARRLLKTQGWTPDDFDKVPVADVYPPPVLENRNSWGNESRHGR